MDSAWFDVQNIEALLK